MRASPFKRIVSLLLLAACAGDTLTPSITPTLTNITVTLGASTVQVGKTVQATAILRDQLGNTAAVRGDTVAWSSSKSDVATIAPATGVVTAVGAGTTTISATASNKTGSVELTVTTQSVESTAPVASVDIALSAPTLQLAQAMQATAVMRDAAKNVLSGRQVGWSSADPTIATVSGAGVVTGTGLGTTIISATSEGRVGDAVVTITAPPPSAAPVAFVNLQIAPQSISIGGTAQGTATVRNIEGGVLSDRTVSWSSSDPNIATVSLTGGITGVANGAATITATSEGKSASAAIVVAPTPVATVSVDVPVEIKVGETVTASATPRDAQGNVLAGRTCTWSSTNTSFFTVSNEGAVKGVAVGTASVVANCDGKTGSAGVRVVPANQGNAAAITVTIDQPTVGAGSTTQARAAVRDQLGNPILGASVGWSSTNPSIATVSGSGVVTGISRGSASIVATIGTVTGSAGVVIGPPIPVASITVDLASSQIAAGSTTQASATLRDGTGNTLSGRGVTWTSSNPSVATVNSSGLVTAVAPGTTNIVASSEGENGVAVLTVLNAQVASVSVTLASSTIAAGGSTQATATTRDASGSVLTGRAIVWSSSNTAVATVNASGLVIAVGSGSASIYGTSEGRAGSAGLTVSGAPVAFVNVSISNTALNVGQSSQATAVTRDASNNVLAGRVVIWSSSNTAVAAVNPTSGLVTGTGPGSASIIAASEGQTGQVGVTVSQAPVSSVSVSLAASTLAAGGTTQATATLRDASSNVLTGRAVTWTSNRPSVATVNAATGVVTAVSSGTASIVATSEGKTGFASVTVSAIPVAAVTVSLANASLTSGQTTQATATMLDANDNVLTGRAVTWSSSNTAVATVNAFSGLVSAIGAGSANIVATSEGKTGQAGVAVSVMPVATVTVSLSVSAIAPGGSSQATATTRSASNQVLTGRTVTWSSSNTAVAVVNATTGAITGVAAGTANIVATSEGKSGQAVITVASAVNSVSVALSTNNIAAGATSQATATLRDAGNIVLTGRTVTWSSSNTAVATVNATGLVTAVSGGTANIVATSEGKAGSSTLTVLATVSTVSVSLSASTVATGASAQATATVRDGNNNILTGRTVAWSSSNTAIAVVNPSTGAITAVSGGTANIVASSEGKTGQAVLTVQNPVNSVSVSLQASTLSLGSASQATATLRDGSGAIVTGRTVVWSSSNTGVATVSSTGLVTAVALGSATIMALCEGKSGFTNVTIAPSSVSVLFADGFESNNLNFTQNGIRWSSTPDVSVGSAIAHGGSRAAVINQANGWGEMRFDGLPQLNEVYIQFWLYMPSGSESPSLGPKISPRGTLNDKFFRLWGTSDADYGIDGTGNSNKVGASTYGDGGGVNGTLAIEYAFSESPQSQWPMGRGNPGTDEVSFFNDANRGRWIKIGIFAKNATSANNNGVVEIFLNGALLTGYRNLQNYPFGSAARRAFTTGYLLGAANNGGRAGQKVYIDDVTFSTGGFPP